MEFLLVAFLALAERVRLDLRVRRAWAGLGVPVPSGAVRVPAPVALAGLDVRRAALRLATLLLAYALWRVYGPAAPKDEYGGLNVLVGQPFLFVGLALVALLGAFGGQDRGNELLEALPRGPRSRVLGTATALAVAAALSYAVVVVARLNRDGTSYDSLLPDGWQLLQVPALVLGGGMLGLLFARFVPGWLAAPLAVVAATTWVIVLSNDDWGTQMLTVLPEWVEWRQDGLVVLEPGSLAWHNGFLLGLCGLGLVAALLRESGRRAALVVAGAVVLAGTAFAGALALP